MEPTPIDNHAASNVVFPHDEILLATTLAALDPTAHINASIIEQQQQHQNLGLVVAAAAAAAAASAAAAINATVPAPSSASDVRLHQHLQDAFHDMPTMNAFGVMSATSGAGQHIMHVTHCDRLPEDRAPFTPIYSHRDQLDGNRLANAALAGAAHGNIAADEMIDILLSPIPAASRSNVDDEGIHAVVKRHAAPRHRHEESSNHPAAERSSSLSTSADRQHGSERRGAHSFQPYQSSRVRHGLPTTGSSSSTRSGNLQRIRRLCHLASASASEPTDFPHPPNQAVGSSVVLPIEPIAVRDEAAQHIVVPIAPPSTVSIVGGYAISSMPSFVPAFTSINSNTGRQQYSGVMPLHQGLYQGNFPPDSLPVRSIMNSSFGVGISSPMMVLPGMNSNNVGNAATLHPAQGAAGYQHLDSSHPHQCRLDHHYHHQLAFRQHCPLSTDTSASANTNGHPSSTAPQRSSHQSPMSTLMPSTLQSYALLNSIAGMGCPMALATSYATGAHSIYDRAQPNNLHRLMDDQSMNALGFASPGSDHSGNGQHSTSGIQQVAPSVHTLNFLHSAVLANRLRQQEEERQRSLEFYHAVQQQQQRAPNQQTGYGAAGIVLTHLLTGHSMMEVGYPGRLLRLPPPMMLAHASIAMPPVSVVPQPVELMVIPPTTAEVATAAHIVLNGTGIGIDAEFNRHHHASVGFRQASAVAAAAGAVVEPQPVGISPEQIERHSIRVNYMTTDDRAAAERERCTVCLVDFEKADELRSLRCSHSFHVDCIDRWLIYNKKCPICRLDMDKPKPAPSDSASCNPTPSTAAGLGRAI